MFPDNLLRLPTLNFDSSGKYLNTCKTVNQVRENRPTPKGNLQDIYHSIPTPLHWVTALTYALQLPAGMMSVKMSKNFF